MKKFKIDSCFVCPRMVEYEGVRRCSNSIHRNYNYRMLHEKDIFEFDEDNEKMSTKYPDWCPLEDY